MKRLVRFAFLASLVAAAVSAVRALRREQDPLPAPPTGTGAGPWPPLQNPSPAPPKPEAGKTAAEKPAPKNTSPKKSPPKKSPAKKSPAKKTAPKKAAPPAPAPDDRDTPNGSVSPEPGGIPVGDSAAGSSGDPWVEPTSEGGCPDGYPIKAKLSSKIFHAPGQLNYDRTTPDRCYVSAEAAEADGLRAAKR